mmetsp:Transcript_13540/g.42615  ORF Transcript_13540/g.42615 Transcript_13540/m.42615 type:complete len:231 (-) Transcript_13540:530-1222(-)
MFAFASACTPVHTSTKADFLLLVGSRSVESCWPYKASRSECTLANASSPSRALTATPPSSSPTNRSSFPYHPTSPSPRQLHSQPPPSLPCTRSSSLAWSTCSANSTFARVPTRRRRPLPVAREACSCTRLLVALARPWYSLALRWAIVSLASLVARTRCRTFARSAAPSSSTRVSRRPYVPPARQRLKCSLRENGLALTPCSTRTAPKRWPPPLTWLDRWAASSCTAFTA